MPHLELDHAALLPPFAGGRELPLQRRPLPNGVPSASQRPTPRVRNRRRVPGRPARVLGPRPTASGGVRRPRPRRRVCSGSCTAASSRVRPRSTASRALAAFRYFLHVILSSAGCSPCGICSPLPPANASIGPRSGKSGLSVPAVRSRRASFHRTKTPACTVASFHASALPTSRGHRSTCVQKNPRAKP